MKGPTSPARQNISQWGNKLNPHEGIINIPIEERPASSEISNKIGKKRQGESNDQEKRKKIRPREEILNQHASQTNGYD